MTTVSPEPSIDDLIAAFRAASDAVAAAVGSMSPSRRRARTARPGQYELDVAADAAALSLLAPLGTRILSEESASSGAHGETVIVVDPVDGSTNCSRGIAYWSTSLCAVDRLGPLVALVRNHASGEETVAIRGRGAMRDGREIRASRVQSLSDAVIALSGRPPDGLRWKQYRVLGCASLTLCDLAAGGIDASVDAGRWHAPWDYLGGLLACREAGASVVDAAGEELVTTAFDARRRVIAAATPELLAEIQSRGVGQ